MIWKQPSKPTTPSTMFADCTECSTPAQFEYCATGQHEPAALAVWIPLCVQCRETSQALVNTQWSSGLVA